MKPLFKICILTFNEELNILDCIASCRSQENVYVIDSNSSDNTVALIQENYPDSTIINAEWRGFANQRNIIHTYLHRNDFVLFIDADERLSVNLIEELNHYVINDKNVVGRIFHSNIFLNQRLNGIRECNTGQLRFGQSRSMNFIEDGHGQNVLTEGVTVVNIINPLIHYPMSKGIQEWFVKHVKYAHHESKNYDNKLKNIVYNLPFFPFLLIIYDSMRYCIFKDGKKGFLYLQMKLVYFLMIRINRKYQKLNHRDL